VTAIAAADTCTRCGVFLTADARRVGGKRYCPTCAVRPDVDYLEAFRLKYWGKRDAWAWLIGISALTSLARAAGALVEGAPWLVVSGLVLAVAGVLFFLGLRWARLAYAAALVMQGTAVALSVGPEDQHIVWGVFVGVALLPLLVFLAVTRDTRSQLFFKDDIPRAKLEKAWHLYANNSLARSGFMLSLLSLMTPVGPLALGLSIAGLARVNPTATPPIGRKGQAIAGIVLSSLSTLFWGTIIIDAIRSP
jgi:hypothetical protein